MVAVRPQSSEQPRPGRAPPPEKSVDWAPTMTSRPLAAVSGF